MAHVLLCVHVSSCYFTIRAVTIRRSRTVWDSFLPTHSSAVSVRPFCGTACPCSSIERCNLAEESALAFLHGRLISFRRAPFRYSTLPESGIIFCVSHALILSKEIRSLAGIGVYNLVILFLIRDVDVRQQTCIFIADDSFRFSVSEFTILR